MINPRPCERKCAKCEQNLHYSRFHTWKIKNSNGTVAIRFARLCKACEQKERNEKKNKDRPFAIIKGRASSAAQKAKTTTEFFMVQMNYASLVEPLRALMVPEGEKLKGNCQGCGHKFVNERDIQIDHVLPPRGEQDWARLHARNLRFICGACNNTKGAKSFDVWLDEQEEARLSNLESDGAPRDTPLWLPTMGPQNETRQQMDLLSA